MKFNVGKWLTFNSEEGGSRSPMDNFWYSPVQPQATSFLAGFGGGSVNQSLQCSGVLACTQVIAQTIAGLPFNVHRRLQGGEGSEIARDHEVHYLIHDSPNDHQTAFEFWEQLAAHMCTWGNAYAKIEYGPKLRVRSLTAILPHLITPDFDASTGTKFFRYREPGGDGGETIMFEHDVLHLPWLGYDGIRGYTPVQLARMAIGMALHAEEYGAVFFKNNAVPLAYIYNPGGLGQGDRGDIARNNLLAWLRKQFQGVRNAHKLGVLENGAEIRTVATNHRDIQFLELREFQLIDICRLYRVPPHLVQSLARATNNNIEHQGIEFSTHTVKPWVARIEQRITKQLFGPLEKNTYYAEFNMDGLLRGDAVSRAEYISKRINSGTMTPNEGRRKENDNPLPGGDQLYINSTMIPLEMAGQQKAIQGAGA